MTHHQDKREEVKLTKEQAAIVQLARYIDRLPGNEYNVFNNITEILGIEWTPHPSENEKI